MKPIIHLAIGIALATLCAQCCFGDTVSVASVIVSPELKRLSGVRVRLATDKAQGGILANDTSTTSGIYNLSTDGVQSSVTGLWVICDDQAYTSDPQGVNLDAPLRGVRMAKPADLIVIPLAKVQADESRAAEAMSAIWLTEAVKQWAGEVNEEQARQNVRSRSLLVLKQLPGIVKHDGTIDADNPALTKIVDSANRRAKSVNPRFAEAPLLDAQLFQARLPNHGQFELAIRSWLKDPAGAPPREVVDAILALRASDIPADWLATPAIIGQAKELVTHSMKGLEGQVQLLITPATEGRPFNAKPLVLNAGTMPSSDALAVWLRENPEARLYLLLSALDRSKSIDQAQRNALQSRLKTFAISTKPMW